MRVAHIADTHLGYRAYNRITSQGLNRREADVFQAFRQALARAAETGVDLVLIAGDLFHVVRPSNLTIQQTFRELAAFRAKSQAPVIIIGGNHDSPRSADTGCILDLFTHLPGIHVVHGKYEQVFLEKLNTSVFCLCHRAVPQVSQTKIEPDPNSKYNVLMVHGTLEGVIRHAYDIHEIRRADVISEAWDYIAFGHYHLFEELAPNAYYCGSLEYTSSNIWSETGKPKGFIEYDLAQRKLVEFHRVETRDVVDLRPIDAREFSVEDLNKMIRSRIESVDGGHENKILRLVIENLHRSVQGDLDYSFVRRVRAEALHFDLVMRPPSKGGLARTSTDAAVSRPLEEEWEEFAKCYDLPQGVERDRLLTLGREYLMRQAEQT